MTREEKVFIKQIHKRIAEISVGSSAIRNQGASGLIDISRKFFYKKINLIEFRKKLISKKYTNYLNRLTKLLVKKFPKKGKSWGAARKGLNLFFREVAYNHYLADYLKITTDYTQNQKLIKNLEVPLDKDVASGLNEIFNDLPKWKSIISLEEPDHKRYQEKAFEYAQKKGTARVHLDLIFWRRKR